MKTVLVTGANRGIGLEFCRQYAADGWRVLACARQPGTSGALHALAAGHPGQVTVHGLDVGVSDHIDALARSLDSHPIDLLLNNAGVYPPDDPALDEAVWAGAFLINAIAPLHMARAFAPHLARGTGKIIATLSSKMGSISDNSSGGSYLYRSSKAAANMLMKTLAVDLAPAGILTVALHPGWVRTDMGGPNALISAEQSVSGMRAVIARLTPADSGTFIAYDGRPVPW
ncbi:SDR family oxidoreductase [Nitrosovibrio sp. Nv17]|uniref:SDR family oxidoreductase n=1 Tax=Nitrosovibrio sp. Nv17 TaxID=1855339 RepID=UPI0009090EAD|nr:SDR family oxidoreductase [Nitrosovibrio sp. Nv17]SFW25177.1 NAD(P)-dependent dehydrogenase, short-chain alcohol dehydrogenase family [Nitrosovibrio sp. Nv17]